MCGRFTLTAAPEVVAARFRVRVDADYGPRYNIAPTQPVLVVRTRSGAVEGELMRWGLVPSWSRGPRSGPLHINARAETLTGQPAFRQALTHRRCLIPADSFYEWRGAGKRRVPFRFTAASGELFVFAGLWEPWKQPEGGWLLSCAIVTTEANPLVAAVHDRMPVILSPGDEALWLDPTVEDPAVLRRLLMPYPAGSMHAYQVTPVVNSALHEGPECIAPALLLA